MPKISRRKRLYQEKRSKSSKKSQKLHSSNSSKSFSDNQSVSDATDGTDSIDNVSGSIGSLQISDHDYIGSHPSQVSINPMVSDNVETSPKRSSYELFFKVKQKLEMFLPLRWECIIDQSYLHVVLISLQKNATVQRSLRVNAIGELELYVHCELVDVSRFIPVELDPPMPLDEDSVNNYVDRIATVVYNVRESAVCSGYDEEKFRNVWSSCPFGEVDKNPYHECRYVETFRASSCKLLIDGKKWRCIECQKMYAPLRRRAAAAAEDERHQCTANKFLTEEQKLKKLQDQKDKMEALRKEKYRLHKKMEELIKKTGVQIEGNLSDDFTALLNDNEKLTPAQSIFLQQQVKASQQKNASGMRWHPTMIRFALSLHMTSPSAYELMRQTGMVKLPSSRTLFDYSHAKPMEEGIHKTMLTSVSERTSKFTEKHKKYFVLMADEMYISQNLVFQKSSGRMIGYTSLDSVDREVRNLDQLIENCEEEFQETLATKVLVYMVKGVSNGIKEVVATYCVGNLSANQLKVWTWQVIGALERSGIAVVAFVSDGSAVNRAFIRKHTPATQHPSGVIFDTWNKAAPERKLYFIADVPHLLKTIRNCFLNSRWDGRKSRRRMVKDGKRISWDYVIKLYEEKKGKTFRKSFKLNPQNVYPDSYARMKVSLAAHVLSNTVAVDMRSQGWFNATETANFIQLVNDWFDCLNGAHSSMGKRRKNSNLDPYSSPNDPRFDKLDEFLNYLEEWENDAQNPNQSVNASTAVDVDGLQDCDESEIEEAGFNAEENTPASRKQLSKQTIEGIKMTTLAFKPLVQFLLGEGANFINARIFCQDPLEQHFSRLRGGCTSNNPNAAQVLGKENAIHIVGQLGIRKRKGNSGEAGDVVEVTYDRLPKRACSRAKKFA